MLELQDGSAEFVAILSPGAGLIKGVFSMEAPFTGIAGLLKRQATTRAEGLSEQGHLAIALRAPMGTYRFTARAARREEEINNAGKSWNVPPPQFSA
jgi:hypothetical protein